MLRLVSTLFVLSALSHSATPPMGSPGLCYAPLAKIAEGEVDALEFQIYSAYQIPKSTLSALGKSPSGLPQGIPENGRVFAVATFNREGGKQELYHTEFEPIDSSHARAPKEIEKHLKLVSRRYHEKGIVTDAEVDHFLTMEKQLNPLRKEYIVFTHRKTGDTKSVIRIYHGSPYIDEWERFRLPLDDGSHLLPLEREFPNLVLPERAQYGNKAFVVELGRLAGDKDIDNTLGSAFNRAASALYYRYSDIGQYPNHPMIYVEATKSGADVYKNLGFEMFKTAEQLGTKPGEGGKYILRCSVESFVKRWHRDYGIVFPSFRKPE